MWWKVWMVAAVFVIVNSPLIAKPADLPVDRRINLAASPDDPMVPATPLAEQPKCPAEAKAVEVFRRAEVHRQKGRMIEARRGYEEVHLIAPTSAVGRQAIQRLREIEAPGNEFYEEQEPPLSRSSYRPTNEPTRPLNQPKPTRQQYEDMLRQTQPLGGVRAPSY